MFSRPGAGPGGQDVTAGGVPRRGQGGGQGARSPPASRPGDRVALISQDPLRVDAARLRDLVRRRRDRAGLRDLLGRAGRSGSCSDSGARAVVAETPEHAGPGQRGARASSTSSTTSGRSTDNAVDILTRLGARHHRRGARGAAYDGRRPRDLATLIYTSGTTGRPKGCMLTHGNFMFELGVAVEELDRLFDADDASTLLFLPLAHVFARIIQVGCVKSRTRLGHSADIKNLVADLRRSGRRSCWPCRASSRRCSTPPPSGPPPTAAARSSTGPPRPRSPTPAACDRGRPSLAVRAQHALFARLVYGRLREALGGRCEYAVSGGAPLGERLGHFYRGIGVTVLEGYGLTETTAAAHRQPAGRAEDRHGRPAAAGHRRPGGRRRRAAVPGRPGLRRLLAQRRGHRRGRSRPTAGSTPATSARSTTRGSSGSPAARRRSW